MKFSISKKSWLYWVASEPGGMSTYGHGSISFCEFFWRFALGSFWLLVMAGLGIISLGGIGVLLYDMGALIVSMFNHSLTKSIEMHISGLMGWILVMILLVGFGYYSLKKNKKQKVVKTDPGFVGQAYTSFKTKTCVKMVFTE